MELNYIPKHDQSKSYERIRRKQKEHIASLDRSSTTLNVNGITFRNQIHITLYHSISQTMNPR